MAKRAAKRASGGDSETDGTKTVLLRINKRGWLELRRLALDLDQPLDSLLIEAANDLLSANGKPKVVEKRQPAKAK